MIQGKKSYFKPASQTITLTEEQEKIIELMLQDFSNLKGHLYKRWMDFVNFVIQNSVFIAKYYQKQYQGLCRDRFKHNVFSHRIKNQDWRVAKYADSGKTNLEHAFMEKKKTVAEEQLWNEHFPI